MQDKTVRNSVDGIQTPDSPSVPASALKAKGGKEAKLARQLDKLEEKKRKDYQGDRLVIEIAYKSMGEDRKAERKHACGTFLQFDVSGDRPKLHRANFCRLPLCPLCATRRARKILAHLSKIITYMDCGADEPCPFRYIHLTLTMKNCAGYDLGSTLSQLLNAFDKLAKRRPFERAVVGYFRKVEISHNWSRGDFHPHLHILMAVKPSYFSGSNYLKADWWRTAWAECLGVDYTPQIKLVPIRRTPIGIANAVPVLEVAKYTSKSMDYIAPSHMAQSQKKTNEAVAALDAAIKKRQLAGYGGEMKRIHKLLNLQAMNEKEIDATAIEKPLAEQLFRFFCWDFDTRHYKERKMT